MQKINFKCFILICFVFSILLCFAACQGTDVDEPVQSPSATPGHHPSFPSGSVIELPEETFTTPEVTPSETVSPEQTDVVTKKPDQTVSPTQSPNVTSTPTSTPTNTNKPPQTTAPTTAPTKTPKPSGGVMLPPDYL